MSKLQDLLDKTTITINHNINYANNCEYLSFNEGIDMIRNGKYRHIVDLHRDFESKIKERYYKNSIKKSLPKIIFDGQYKSRNHEGLIGDLNGIMTIDFDNVTLEKKGRVKELVVGLTMPLALFDSVSKDGIKVLYKTDVYKPDEFEFAQKILIDQIKTKLQIYQDIESFDYDIDYVSHSMGFFIPYDDDMYYEPEKTQNYPLTAFAKEAYQAYLEKMKVEAKKRKRTYSSTSNEDVKRKLKILDNIYDYMENNDILFADYYKEWQMIGLAIYYEIQDFDIATDYFIKFSSLSPKFSLLECNREAEKLYTIVNHANKDYKNPVTLGKIIYLAKEVGYKYDS